MKKRQPTKRELAKALRSERAVATRARNEATKARDELARARSELLFAQSRLQRIAHELSAVAGTALEAADLGWRPADPARRAKVENLLR